MIFPTIHIPDSKPVQLLSQLREGLARGAEDTIRSTFQDPHDSRYLFAMANNRGGLKKVHIAIIPTPPGWKGNYWAIFHAIQTIEEDHDPVYEVLPSANGSWQLGKEVPEDQTGGWRINSMSYKANLNPADSKVFVSVDLRLRSGSSVAIPFRLNDNFDLSSPAVKADDRSIPEPKEGQLVRAGSLLIDWTKKPRSEFKLAYSAVLPKSDEDEITPNDAYVTAWWLPSLARLPFTVKASIEGPAAWKLRGEGFETSDKVKAGRRVATFDCNVPISYPKIVAGLYRQMAKATVNGDTFKIWQVEPTDQARADHDLKKMIEAATYYRKHLGRLPFHGYECYDATRYYGIESYSHTLLQRDVTHFISHEMGHTYFGGLAPCPYVHDSWNEGVTEYIDSVALLHDEDHSLEAGLRTVNIGVPLTQMPIPWNLGDATYWRGCYVVKMLEAEMGQEKVLRALKRIASERRGMDTRWDDLRTYFEQEGGKPLDWFWAQWVDNAEFPKVSYAIDVRPAGKNKTVTRFDLAQSGTPHPYRIKLLLRVSNGDKKLEKLVDLDDAAKSFELETPGDSAKAEVVLFPYTLAALARK